MSGGIWISAMEYNAGYRQLRNDAGIVAVQEVALVQAVLLWPLFQAISFW